MNLFGFQTMNVCSLSRSDFDRSGFVPELVCNVREPFVAQCVDATSCFERPGFAIALCVLVTERKQNCIFNCLFIVLVCLLENTCLLRLLCCLTKLFI